MALPSIEAVAFSMPGGEVSVPSRCRPVDLVHLARQTMGDRSLEQEVLALFLNQARSVREQLQRAEAKERATLAHGIKGSARGIGAFALAKAAGEVEDDADSAEKASALVSAIDEAREFIAAISR